MTLRQRPSSKMAANSDHVHHHHDEAKEPLVTIVKTEVRSPPVKKLGLFSLIGLSIVLTQVFCEVTKQTSNYSMQYYNNGKYPISQTMIVVVCEAIKLIVTIMRSKCSLPSFSFQSLRSSLRFLLPSVLYAINNNLYYAGLTLVPPPIWLILCSVRTVVTASIYKFVLRRQLTKLQFVGALLIVISIGIAKTPDITQLLYPSSNSKLVNSTISQSAATSENSVNAIPITAIVLALICACNSVAAAVYTEQLFKNSTKGESFLDQQFWLYFYGTLVASTVHFLSAPHYTFRSLIKDVLGLNEQILGLFAVAVLFTSTGGIVIASILKYLDNIVKEYTGSVANILTAVVSSFLFPDKFEFTPYIILSMGCLLTGIYLYETQKAANNVTNNSMTAPVSTKVAGAKTATKTKNVENSKK